MYHKQRSFKTREAIEWSYNVHNLLNRDQDQEKLKRLRNTFDPKSHYYTVEIWAAMPSFFTKKGNISSRTHDVTNFEKPLLDLLTDPKYYNIEPPAGCQNLNVNDKIFCDLISKKRPSKDGQARLIITIGIKDLKDLDPL